MQRICAMNKENWADYLEFALEGCQSTFKKTSVDNSDKNNLKYLCHDDDETKKVYNFDSYVKKQYPNSNRPSSPDAIYIGKNKLYLVEFKNVGGKTLENSKDIDRIKSKFESGTKILQELLKEYNLTDCKKYFCVVYNKSKQKNQKSKYDFFNVGDAIEQIVNEETFNNSLDHELSKLNSNGFYNSILVRDVDFYKKEFIDLSCD